MPSVFSTPAGTDVERPTDVHESVSRRHFLRDIAALSVTGGVLAGCARSALGTSADANTTPNAPGRMSSGSVVRNPSVDGIGLQLYTVSDQLRTNFEGTIEQVAKIGYKQVEFAGYFNRTPEQVRTVLERFELTSPSTHIGMDALRNDFEAQVHIAQAVGHEYITIPSLGRTDTPLNTIDAWKRIADECNTLGAALHGRGLKLAFHSHTGEFVDVGGGQTGMDVFLRETDPAVFNFQMDLGWARVAGQDPVAWFRKYPNRFCMWHVKDFDMLTPRGRPTPVGLGVINFAPMLAQWKLSGMHYFFVEQDGAAQWPGGSLASIATSYTNLRKQFA